MIISIGLTDLKNGTSLPEMKRLFTLLFLTMENYRLRPLVTTIMCFGSYELIEKAKIFNKFLHENFENVIDLWDVFTYGLENTLVNMYKR